MQYEAGVAALEDKIVQKAVVDVILTPIYEPEFLGFSYGFRPGRGAHDALDALAFGIERRKVNWIVDADIRAFFDRLSRDQLLRFLEHRIGDNRVLRLITKWLNAGVMEGTEWKDDLRGTPQGAVVSPISSGCSNCANNAPTCSTGLPFHYQFLDAHTTLTGELLPVCGDRFAQVAAARSLGRHRDLRTRLAWRPCTRLATPNNCYYSNDAA